MQSITWSKEEFQASVNAKLALLRAHREADRGLSLEQRLALVEDRTEFERVRQDAARKRMALIQAGPAGLLAMKPNRTLQDTGKPEGFTLSRFDDGQEADKPTNETRASQKRTDSFAASPSGDSPPSDYERAQVRPDMSGARDSYASDFQLKPLVEQPFVPRAQRDQQAVANNAGADAERKDGTHVQPFKQVIGFAAEELSPDENFTEVPADKVRFRPANLYRDDDLVAQPAELLDPEEDKRRRLVEQTQRQSSEKWVVLDRATALSCLAAHPNGLTMVDLAFEILGSAASERDTRRLSALMRREEQRQNVATGGRSKPIVITPAGYQALAEMDIKEASKEAAKRRLKRLESQRHRLLGEPNRTATEKAAAKAAARAALLQVRADKKAAKLAEKNRSNCNTEPKELSPRRYKLGKPLQPGESMKPTGLTPGAETDQTSNVKRQAGEISNE